MFEHLFLKDDKLGVDFSRERKTREENLELRCNSNAIASHNQSHEEDKFVFTVVSAGTIALTIEWWPLETLATLL